MIVEFFVRAWSQTIDLVTGHPIISTVVGVVVVAANVADEIDYMRRRHRL